MIGLAGDTTQDLSTSRLAKSYISASLSSPNIGDTVRLPDGQQGILRYAGPIAGKSGDFAGIELIDEWASQGRHNGEYNG